MNNITPFNLYTKLYDGECIEFDLLEGGKHCGFKFEKDFSVRSYNPMVLKKLHQRRPQILLRMTMIVTITVNNNDDDDENGDYGVRMMRMIMRRVRKQR